LFLPSIRNRGETQSDGLSDFGGSYPRLLSVDSQGGFVVGYRETLIATSSLGTPIETGFTEETKTPGFPSAEYDLRLKLPVLVPIVLDSFNAADPSAFRWDAPQPTGSYDIAMAYVTWVTDGRFNSWVMNAPAGLGSVRIPELPFAMQSYAPNPSSVVGNRWILFMDGGDLNYDAMAGLGGVTAYGNEGHVVGHPGIVRFLGTGEDLHDNGVKVTKVGSTAQGSRARK
jgi:hypothetical protein